MIIGQMLWEISNDPNCLADFIGYGRGFKGDTLLKLIVIAYLNKKWD